MIEPCCEYLSVLVLICTVVVGSSPAAVTYNSDFVPVSGKEFLDIQVTIECGFTLKRLRDMIRTYSHYFLFSICCEYLSVRVLICTVFVSELRGCGFESSCSHL